MRYSKKGGTMDNPFEILMTEIQSLKKIISNLSTSTNTLHEKVYLKIDEAAKFLSMSKNALNQMVYKKQILALKKQGKLYFLKSELIEWLESGRESNENIRCEDFLQTNTNRRQKRTA